MRICNINVFLEITSSRIAQQPGTVVALEVEPGETVSCSGENRSWEVPVVLMADNVSIAGQKATCSKIWQVLQCPSGAWGQTFVAPHQNLRMKAQAINAPLVEVADGIPPLTCCQSGEVTVAVPDFETTGTRWYLAPLTRDFIHDQYVKLYFYDDELEGKGCTPPLTVCKNAGLRPVGSHIF